MRTVQAGRRYASGAGRSRTRALRRTRPYSARRGNPPPRRGTLAPGEAQERREVCRSREPEPAQKELTAFLDEVRAMIRSGRVRGAFHPLCRVPDRSPLVIGDVMPTALDKWPALAAEPARGVCAEARGRQGRFPFAPSSWTHVSCDRHAWPTGLGSCRGFRAAEPSLCRLGEEATGHGEARPVGSSFRERGCLVSRRCRTVQRTCGPR